MKKSVVRSLWLDNLRAVACLLVVLLHTSSSYLYQWNKISFYSWQVGNVVDSFTRICVPLFFMISGYLFFRDKKPKYNNYLKIITALLFYTVLYSIVLSISNRGSFIDLISNAFYNPVYYHLWFFYALPLVYLVSNLVCIRKENYSILGLLVFFVVLFILFNPSLKSGFSIHSCSPP